MRRFRTLGILVALITAASVNSSLAGEPASLLLKNDHVLRELRLDAGCWRTVRFARADGSDELTVRSDEFHILPLDTDKGWTVSDYRAVGAPVRKARDGIESVVITYHPRKPLPPLAPKEVMVTYCLGAGPYHHKAVSLVMDKGEFIDRLQVERFSSGQRASRGGFGQPVFVGNWFCGMDYPGFYSWHSDGCVEPDYNYRWFYDVDLKGRQQEFTTRKGLVTLFHFPGHVRRNGERWGIVSKRSVIGISRRPGDHAELGLLDYMTETRKPTRSHLHFNNWYSSEAKFITQESFVENTARPLVEKLAEQGAHLDAMVPDHGWQDSKAFDRIYQPQSNPTHEPLPDIRHALEQLGTKLGIWIALDGTNSSVGRGRQLGYRSAYANDCDRSRRWRQGKDYFDILDPKYMADLKTALRFLLMDAGVDYIKHDFNHNFTSHYITERHARERCLDATLDLLAYELSLHPGVFQNYTNGSWFSPWWLQHVDTLWMMSGDSGNNTSWPQVSLRDNATTYRDAWIFQSFNNPERCPRPILPVANLMTHGILFSKRKPYTDFKDPLHEWSDYVVMHLARGTIVKELYVDLDMLDDDHWKVLGRAAAWAQQNQKRLMNTVYVGGDPGAGAVYGYVSWVAGRAILSVRNPDRREQVLTVPFDRSVYFRGDKGQDYHARTIYPFVEPMPWKLTSGRPVAVPVPGDSVMVFELEPGPAAAGSAAQPAPLPDFQARTGNGEFSLKLDVPGESLPRYDLLVQPWAPVDIAIEIDGEPVSPSQFQQASGWTLARYDLRRYRGRSIHIRGTKEAAQDPRLGRIGKVAVEAWLVVDRRVDATPQEPGAGLPWAISQSHRRITQNLIPRTPL